MESVRFIKSESYIFLPESVRENTIDNEISSIKVIARIFQGVNSKNFPQNEWNRYNCES